MIAATPSTDVLRHGWLDAAATLAPDLPQVADLLSARLNEAIATGRLGEDDLMATIAEVEEVASGAQSGSAGALARRLRRTVYEYLLALDATTAVEAQYATVIDAQSSDEAGAVPLNEAPWAAVGPDPGDEVAVPQAASPAEAVMESPVPGTAVGAGIETAFHAPPGAPGVEPPPAGYVDAAAVFAEFDDADTDGDGDDSGGRHRFGFRRRRQAGDADADGAVVFDDADVASPLPEGPAEWGGAAAGVADTADVATVDHGVPAEPEAVLEPTDAREENVPSDASADPAPAPPASPGHRDDHAAPVAAAPVGPDGHEDEPPVPPDERAAILEVTVSDRGVGGPQPPVEPSVTDTAPRFVAPRAGFHIVEESDPGQVPDATDATVDDMVFRSTTGRLGAFSDGDEPITDDEAGWFPQVSDGGLGAPAVGPPVSAIDHAAIPGPDAPAPAVPAEAAEAGGWHVRRHSAEARRNAEANGDEANDPSSQADDPFDTDARLFDMRRKIQEKLGRKRCDDAAALLQMLAQDTGGRAVAELAMDAGDRCRGLGKNNAALSCYLAASRADPVFELPLRRLADICIDDQDIDLAVSYLERIARLHRLRGNEKEALRVYRRIVTVAPYRDDILALLMNARSAGHLDP